jgi:hypothetical protein
MEITAKILRELPDGELIETLEYLLKLTRKDKSKHSSGAQVLEEMSPPSQEMIDRLANMSSPQIEQFLSTSKEFGNLKRMRELANHLGIKMSRRQNHAALVNVIVRHFEARRMDFIIRGGQTKDDPPLESDSN